MSRLMHLRRRVLELVSSVVELVGTRRTPEPPPDWSVPPRRTPLDETVTVRVLGSDRLRTGLGEVWRVVDQTFPHPADFAVVEPQAVAALTRDRLPEPYVLWATDAGPPTGVDQLVQGAAAVFVADPDHLEAWQTVAPEAQLLPPAASARVLPAREREGVAVIATGPLAPEVAGAAATVVARALRPLQESLVARRVDTLAPLPRVVSGAVTGDGSYADAATVIAGAAVLADGLRRTRGDTWTVLDAAAAGTPVVTVDRLPAPFAVATAATEQDFRAELVARLHQPELRDREGLRLRRAVLDGHTWAHRGAEIADVVSIRPRSSAYSTSRAAVGLDTGSVVEERACERLETPYSTSERSVSAIVPTNRVHELDNVLANLGRQRHTDTELVLVLHGLEVDEAELRKRAADAGVTNLELVAAPASHTLGACLNAGIERASGEVIAKLDDDNHYGANYLTDLLHGFETSGAEIVGKWAHYVWLQATGAVVLRYPDAEHTYQRRIQGGSMLFDGDLLRALCFADLPRAVDSDVLDRALAEGVKVWSGDRFNYVSIRGVDRTAHTWTVSDASFLTASGRLEFYGDPRPHVEV